MVSCKQLTKACDYSHVENEEPILKVVEGNEDEEKKRGIIQISCYNNMQGI